MALSWVEGILGGSAVAAAHPKPGSSGNGGTTRTISLGDSEILTISRLPHELESPTMIVRVARNSDGTASSSRIWLASSKMTTSNSPVSSVGGVVIHDDAALENEDCIMNNAAPVLPAVAI
jgi:hypothetical protein